MAVTNLTEDENRTAFRELSCSAEFTRQVHKLIFLSMLVALDKEISLHPPSKLLYHNLAITDLRVGIIAEPLAVAYWISVVNERWKICYYANLAGAIASEILCSVSLYTLTAISVDRLLALLQGLRSRQVVTLKKAYVCAFLFWVFSIVGSLKLFRICKMVWFGRVSYALCVVATIFSYTKIFFSLRCNQIQIQDHISQGQSSKAIPLHTARYKKTVFSALWVQVAFVVCYLPFGIALTFTHREAESVYLATQFTLFLLYLNSSLNPMLYCWKIRELRQAVTETLRQMISYFAMLLSCKLMPN